MTHRVVITGQGTINALGVNVPETLAAMREGRCGIGPLVSNCPLFPRALA